MSRVGIALGSNLGNRLSNIRIARDALREIAAPDEPFLEGAIYQTEPMFCPPGSPQFYNSVVEIGFAGSPLELLEITKALEIKLGRTAANERNAPRIIDVDLLYFSDRVIDTEELVLPHPRISERSFVLQPLADLRPDLVLCGKDQSIQNFLDALSSQEAPLIRVADAGGRDE